MNAHGRQATRTNRFAKPTERHGRAQAGRERMPSFMHVKKVCVPSEVRDGRCESPGGEGVPSGL